MLHEIVYLFLMHYNYHGKTEYFYLSKIFLYIFDWIEQNVTLKVNKECHFDEMQQNNNLIYFLMRFSAIFEYGFWFWVCNNSIQYWIFPPTRLHHTIARIILGLIINLVQLFAYPRTFNYGGHHKTVTGNYILDMCAKDLWEMQW